MFLRAGGEEGGGAVGSRVDPCPGRRNGGALGLDPGQCTLVLFAEWMMLVGARGGIDWLVGEDTRALRWAIVDKVGIRTED